MQRKYKPNATTNEPFDAHTHTHITANKKKTQTNCTVLYMYTKVSKFSNRIVFFFFCLFLWTHECGVRLFASPQIESRCLIFVIWQISVFVCVYIQIKQQSKINARAFRCCCFFFSKKKPRSNSVKPRLNAFKCSTSIDFDVVFFLLFHSFKHEFTFGCLIVDLFPWVKVVLFTLTCLVGLDFHWTIFLLPPMYKY